MYCTFCGSENNDLDNFCQACGNNLKAGTTVDETGYAGGGGVEYQPVNFKVEQKFFALRPTYKISDATGQEFMVARKSWFSFFRPYLEIEDMQGKIIGTIQSNLWRTSWEIRDEHMNLHATITFPFIMFFRKNFQIHTANGIYNSGDSYFSYRFDAYAPSGQLAFTVNKKIFSIRDSFQIESFGGLSPFLTCLAAVCIDQKFHQKDS